MDQEYEAFLVKNILAGAHFPLIGVNASDTGLYLGPAFIYLATIPYFLFHGNPLGGGVFAALLGIGTTFFLYKLGTLWFGKKIGLLASLFWAISFIAVLYDRQFWNPTPIPFLTILTCYYLTKIIQGKGKYLIVLAISLGLALQSHLQAIIIFAVSLVYLYIYRRRFSKKYLMLFIFIFVLIQLPLIFFDMRHQLTNTKAFLNLIFSFSSRLSTNPMTSIFDRLTIFTSLLGRTFYIKSPVDLYLENGQCASLLPYIGKTEIVVIGLVLLSIFIYFGQKIVIKYKNSQDYNLIFSITFATILSLIFYHRPIFEYYFLFFLPILVLIASWIFLSLWQKGWKILILTLAILFILSNSKSFFMADMSFSFKYKLKAINFAKQYVDNGNFSLEALGECGRFGGYRYLFEYFGKKPGSSYMDPYFAWIYGKPMKKNYPKSIVFSVIDERDKGASDRWTKQEQILSHRMITSAQFGKIRVLIVDNENN